MNNEEWKDKSKKIKSVVIYFWFLKFVICDLDLEFAIWFLWFELPSCLFIWYLWLGFDNQYDDF